MSRRPANTNTVTATHDFRIQDGGSIIVLHPDTDAAREWVADHIPDDATRWCGGIAVELRFIRSIIEGIQGDGLTVA